MNNLNNSNSEQQTTSGAALVFEVLQQQGVEHVFGYPGGAIMPIYDALRDSKVKHFLCRHEQGAAFSAIGYARAAKKVGVCFATSGPGATNLITGLADAMSDSIPLVAITGQVPTPAMGSDAFQEVDIIGLSLACTKHSFQVRDVNQLGDILNQAFAIALAGRQGPVLVDIPKDIQTKPVKRNLALLSTRPLRATTATTTATTTSTSPDATAALALLRQAKKPLLYVGGGVGMADAVDELRAFMDLSGIPGVATLKGLGAIDCNDPCYLGMLGMHGTKAANLAVQQSDLLIAVGARFDDRVTGKLADFAPNAKVIHFDIDAAELGKRRVVDVAFSGDLKINLPVLAIPLQIDPWREHCRQLARDHAHDYRYAYANDSCDDNETNHGAPDPGIYAPAVLKEISDSMNSDTVVTTDVGQHQMWAAQHMKFTRPNNFLTSGGQGAMGFGLPAAIGAQIARPDDTVVVISGDGSFMMNVQELATIKRYRLALKIVLVDNSRLGMVRQWQELFFEERYSETDLSDNPDFVALAGAFEIKGQLVSDKAQVTAAINAMFAHDGPYLLQLKINPLDNVWPLVPPNAGNDQMIESKQDLIQD